MIKIFSTRVVITYYYMLWITGYLGITNECYSLVGCTYVRLILKHNVQLNCKTKETRSWILLPLSYLPLGGRWLFIIVIQIYRNLKSPAVLLCFLDLFVGGLSDTSLLFKIWNWEYYHAISILYKCHLVLCQKGNETLIA